MPYSKEQQEKIIDHYIDTGGSIEYLTTETGIDWDDLHEKLTILSLDADAMIRELKKNNPIKYIIK